MALHKTIQGLEQLHGGQAWFNVGGGTGGFSYGSNIAQALVRANSYADINVTFLNQQQQAAARAGAVLDELGRGEAGVTGAYNYVRAPTEKFTPLTNLAPGLVAPTLIGALIPWGSLQGAFSTWLSETTGYNFGVGPSVEV